jgi:cyanophycinase-like exopeptidase
MVAGGLGVDERTALIVHDGGLRVEGEGGVWRVMPTEGGVLISTIGSGSRTPSAK